ncbi:hypothetical protein D3C83_313900 [compost metagenome]
MPDRVPMHFLVICQEGSGEGLSERRRKQAGQASLRCPQNGVVVHFAGQVQRVTGAGHGDI